jgi:predicted nucleic acid-binding protein
VRAAADSSFLISCYSLDANSPSATSALASQDGPILVNPLNLVEVAAGLNARIFRGHATEQEVHEALSEFEADLASGLLTAVSMPAAVWLRSRDLALLHSATRGVRSLDILHVAAALGLGATSFLTFDKRQAALARAEGLLTPIEIA